MKISVALCTYNGELFLAEQLDSIIRQSMPVDEIIICDDRSSDNTVPIIHEFCARFPGLISLHINEQNIGAKKNFEQACTLCTGDILFFSDQDDRWMPEKVAVMVRALQERPEFLGVFSDARLINESNEEIGPSFWESLSFTSKDRAIFGTERLYEFILGYTNVVAGSMLAIRREALPHILPFKIMHAVWHDEWIALALSSLNKLLYLDQPLIYYRLHPDQQIGIGTKESHKEWLQSLMRKKDIHNFFNDPLEYFNHYWNAYDRQRLFAGEAPILEKWTPTFRKAAFEAKKKFLLQKPWLPRKGRLLKWYFMREFETTFKEFLQV